MRTPLFLQLLLVLAAGVLGLACSFVVNRWFFTSMRAPHPGNAARDELLPSISSPPASAMNIGLAKQAYEAPVHSRGYRGAPGNRLDFTPMYLPPGAGEQGTQTPALKRLVHFDLKGAPVRPEYVPNVPNITVYCAAVCYDASTKYSSKALLLKLCTIVMVDEAVASCVCSCVLRNWAEKRR